MMVCRITNYKIYYVDAVNGSDSNTGESTSNAWKTLGFAVNSVRNKSLGYGGAIDLQILSAGTHVCPDLSAMRDLLITGNVAGVVLEYHGLSNNDGTLYNLECQFMGLTLDLTNNPYPWSVNNQVDLNVQGSDLEFINCVINGSVGYVDSDIMLGGKLPSGGGGKTTVYAKQGAYAAMYLGDGTVCQIGEDNVEFLGAADQLGVAHDVSGTGNVTNGVLITDDAFLGSSTCDVSYQSLKSDTYIGYYATVKSGIGTPNGIDVKQSTQTAFDNSVPVVVARTPTSDDPRLWEVVYKPFLDSYKEIRRFKSNFNYSEFPTMSGVVTFEMIKLGTEYYIRVADFIGYNPKGTFIESDCLYNNIDSNNECNMTQYVFEAYYHSFLCTAYTTRVRLSQVNEMTSGGEWHYNINASMSFGKRAQSNQLSIYLKLNNQYHHCVVWGTLKLSESPWIQLPDGIPKTF